jgi:hypothetical protein
VATRRRRSAERAHVTVTAPQKSRVRVVPERVVGAGGARRHAGGGTARETKHERRDDDSGAEPVSAAPQRLLRFGA